jgi:hypothetical protein
LARIAAAFPWVASILLHTALGLILLLMTIVLTQTKSEDRFLQSPPSVTASTAELDGKLRLPDPSEKTPRQPNPSDTRGPSLNNDAPIRISRKQEDLTDPSIGIGSAAGPSGGRLAEQGLRSDGGFFGVPADGEDGIGPGAGGKVDVVYVLDRSGSMVHGGLFDVMCRELARSLSAFQPGFQRYHVVFFGDGTCHEAPSRGLTEPTDLNLEATVEWAQKLRASGQTDPARALGRAFDVLARRKRRGRSAVIFLLTDAAFPDNEAVRKLIRRRNRNRDVRIHTFLLGGRSRDAVDVMKQIASENGGKYKYIAGE